ncbi:MAG: MoxR family ATPase [Victivallales bacterium]|jgi:MoxR-like ATPase|nr:MoxR family ATPase [Victivallales bacterium]
MENLAELLSAIPEKISAIKAEISKRIYGQDELIDFLLGAIFADGHCLITGVPGLAKTLLVNSIAEIAALNFKRISFTPDMMPGDITGGEILDFDRADGERRFKFLPGPVFTQLLLADEINRTTPKTQSALLEAMQERIVTVAGKSYPLEKPFFVLATQNPIEQEGTYPLPEAQLDRFMFGLKVDYPDFDEELRIVCETTNEKKIQLNKVISAEEIIAMQQIIRCIPVPESVAILATKIVRATRPAPENPTANKYFRWGAGPRAGQNLILGAKAFAAFDGRVNVAEKDILKVLEPVLNHRLVFNYRAESEQISTKQILTELLNDVL